MIWKHFSITFLIIQTLVCVYLYRSLLARWRILRERHCNQPSRLWYTVARPQLTISRSAGGSAHLQAELWCILSLPSSRRAPGQRRAATVPNRLCESHCSNASTERGRTDGLLCKQLLVLSGCV